MQDQTSTLQQQNINLEATPKINDKNPQRVFVVLCTAAILAVGTILAFMPQKQNFSNTNLDIASSPSPSQLPLVPLTENEYITKDTIIAKSLDTPPLYSGATWDNMPNASTEVDINKVYVESEDNPATFPFNKGRVWKTSVNSYDSPDLEKYYYEFFQKEGWFEEDGTGSLKFTTFSLSLSADNPCGGITGYIGYKNGMVRLISIKRTLIPCNPPQADIATQTTNYVLFVSDSLPIETIAGHIKAKSESE